jgi:hypothetical protein
VEHPEQPPLLRVGDDGVGRELAARRDADESRLVDVGVDVVVDVS